MTIRAPAVAGTFYPANPDALDRAVRGALAAAQVEPVPAKAIVAPHAGYIYSGPIAGTSFQSVAHLRDRIRRIVLIGPTHRMHFFGIAVPTATGLATPLGTVAIDHAGVDVALQDPDVRLIDAAFDGEHALEVELPFIQVLFPRAAVVPLIVGETSVEAVERVLATLWGGPETLIIVSSDLSHYHDYDAARSLDLITSQAIEVIAPARVDANGACGHRAIAGLLRRAHELDLRATTRDLRNSGDTRGPRDRVVGYGAYTFEDAETARLADSHRRMLVDAAYATLRHIAAKGRPPELNLLSFPPALRAQRATFVTIELGGQLRGCVGTVAPVAPLIADVVANTHKAALQDHRFNPMSAQEISQATISISILSHLRCQPFVSDADLLDRLRPGVDGLMIRQADHRALFLPKVWSDLPSPPDFLGRLKQKAGLPNVPLAGTASAFRFTAETFA
ncbi:MAG: AmmeMemoRadiSam system protein B [Xanthobacteraceae bacterium]|nr:AmmeMemoRadiSam system protein B [Xanthobacteraceae bacterium]